MNAKRRRKPDGLRKAITILPSLAVAVLATAFYARLTANNSEAEVTFVEPAYTAPAPVPVLVAKPAPGAAVSLAAPRQRAAGGSPQPLPSFIVFTADGASHVLGQNKTRDGGPWISESSIPIDDTGSAVRPSQEMPRLRGAAASGRVTQPGRSLALGDTSSPLAPKRNLGKKVALLIGNRNYPGWPLKNTVKDARDMAAVLRQLQFEVQPIENASQRSMEEAIGRFVAALDGAEVGLFYFAGHGFQAQGENHLLPVDFNSNSEADAKFTSYSASRLLEHMERSSAALKVLVLDACRDNPFGGSKSFASGLAPMYGAAGTFVAFATAAGRAASDNPAEDNGLFAKHLIRALGQPGLNLDQVFNRVRHNVWSESRGEQLPTAFTSVTGDVVLHPPDGAGFYVNRAVACLLRGEPESSIADLTRALHADPHNAYTVSNRGVAHALAGRLDKALGDFEEAVRLRPGDSHLLYNRALAGAAKAR